MQLVKVVLSNAFLSGSIFFYTKKKKKKKYSVHEGTMYHYQRDNTTCLYWIDIICITSVTLRGNWLIDETRYPKEYF